MLKAAYKPQREASVETKYADPAFKLPASKEFYQRYGIVELGLEKEVDFILLIYLFFLAVLVACISSGVRDPTRTTAAAHARAVTMLDT